MIINNRWMILFSLFTVGLGVCTVSGQILIETDTTQTVQTFDDEEISEEEDNIEEMSEKNGDEEKTHFSLWGEIYDESIRSQRDRSNLNSSSHIRQGFKINWDWLTLQTYLFCRYGKDLKRDFWNNRFEGGIGIRSRFFEKVFLAFFAEYLQGKYLDIPVEYPQPEQKKYTDFRSGLIFWYGWDTYYEPSKWLTLPMIFWGDIYGDLIYYKKNNHNTIGYLQSKLGFHLLRIWKITIDAYAVTYLVKDINEDFWNNYAEFGPGIWLKPLPDLDLKFYIEWLEGSYFNIERPEDPNPNTQRYQDRKMGILFWFGW